MSLNLDIANSFLFFALIFLTVTKVFDCRVPPPFSKYRTIYTACSCVYVT